MGHCVMHQKLRSRSRFSAAVFVLALFLIPAALGASCKDCYWYPAWNYWICVGWPLAERCKVHTECVFYPVLSGYICIDYCEISGYCPV